MLALALLVVSAPPPPHPAVAACPRVLNGDDAAGSVGTAVCIGHKDGRAYLLSASHVVLADRAQTFQFFTAADGDRPARELVGGDIVLRLADPDLVLIRLPADGEPLPEVPLVGRWKRPRTFPAAAGTVGCPDGKPPVFRPDVVLDKKLVRRPSGGLGFFWETEVPPVGGMSGGPLLDKYGTVIGICTAVGRGSGRGYFTHADEILAALGETEHRWLLK